MAKDEESARPSTDSELFKERFAFASGNILASGLLVLNLWPVVARYQTGIQVHFWTTNTPGEGVQPQLWVFWLATGFLATGICAVLLAAVHILCRGLWLGSRTGSDPDSATPSPQRTLHRLADTAYGASFIAAAFLLFLSVLTQFVLLSAGMEQLLIHRFALSGRAAGWASRSVLVVMLLWALWKWLFPRLRDNAAALFAGGSDAFAGRSYALAFFLFMALWMAVIEFCHTVDLTVDRELVAKSRRETVRVDVILGGATSDPALARLSYRSREGGAPQPLALTELGNGRYVAMVPVETVAAGAYDVVIEYPHWDLSATFPHLQRTRKSRGLVVLP